jgi:hypothetical protein
MILDDSVVVFNSGTEFQMQECTLTLSSASPIAVTIGEPGKLASDIVIRNCVITSSPGNPGGTGLSVLSCDRLHVLSTRFEGFNQGIALQPGAGDVVSHLEFTNVDAFTSLDDSDAPGAGASVLIQPAESGVVSNAVFVGCSLAQTEAMSSVYTYGGVYIDGSNGVVDQVRLVSCFVCYWPGPGLEVSSASNIEVIGGSYSCNGSYPMSPHEPKAGIAVGADAVIRITGAACTNSVYDDRVGWLPNTQEFGVSINGDSVVFVRDSDLNGNVTQAIYVGSSSATVEVTECAGYNDLTPPLPTPPTNSDFNGPDLGYYGPVTFYVWGGIGVSVSIDGSPTGLAHGTFAIAPTQTAHIAVTGLAPPSRVAFGQ